jgi:hypothetical protein
MNATDSVELNNVWTDFFKAIENKDTKKIKYLSLEQIDCALCISTDTKNDPPLNYLIPIDTFINQSNRDFINSQLFRAIKKRGIKISEMILVDYKPQNLPKSYGKDFIVYEVWVQTYLPNEWALGHEGQSHSFQFVKINNKFKFYGLTSVP